MENNFGYWLEIEKSELIDTKEKIIMKINENTSPDTIICFKKELNGQLLLFHVLKYKENYIEYIQRAMREVFFELYNMTSIPVKIENKIEGDAICATIEVNVKPLMEQELGEDVELEHVKSCIRNSLEKHFGYVDLIDTTKEQLIPEVIV
ncbi:MAG: hypothetical protein ABIB47_04365 [Candidatus Woesearchaeota archaeon]